jgi:UDP-N-acetylmuramoyl-tripeptide--D-alanyl-D-alanine ligase
MIQSGNIQSLEKAFSYRNRLTFPFIGITGSNGKTTTKCLLCSILRTVGSVYEFSDYSGSYRRIADELLNIPHDVDWAVTKVGIGQHKEISRTTKLLNPYIGIVTNVGEAHLAYHGSIATIANEKMQLIFGIQSDGTAIVNFDNDYTRSMAKKASVKVKTFALNEHADYYASNIEHHGPRGMSLTIRRKIGSRFRLCMPIYSMGDVYNTLAAVAAADVFNIPEQHITSALEHDFILPKGRGRLYQRDDFTLIDDTYDSTPQSLLKSSKCLADFKPFSNRLVMVLGDMAGLGYKTLDLHKAAGHYLAAMPIDVFLFVGKNAQVMMNALNAYRIKERLAKAVPTVDRAIEILKELISAGDTIMIEGNETQSHSPIVDALLKEQV